jgi:inner membrane protein involved in colicin E2 resistance
LATAFAEDIADVAAEEQSAQGFKVLFEDRILPHQILQTAQIALELRRGGIGQGVDGPVLIAGGFDQALFPEISEVPGSVDLGDIQYVLNMADTERGLLQQRYDPQAGLIAQALVNTD